MLRSAAKRLIRPSMSQPRNSSSKPDPPPGYTIDPTAPPMLRYQSSLPTLPVPTLPSTLAKYLDSLKPLLTPPQLAHTRALVAQFQSSQLAQTLQRRLQARAQEQGRENWLADWWNEAAYMGYRDPVVVFVSYFFVYRDSAVERMDQVGRAAALLKAMLPFRALVEEGRLEPDRMKTGPLCMASYAWLFHSSRYPAKPVDGARKYGWKENDHVVVLRKNRLFVVPLSVGVERREVSLGELERMFTRVKELAGEERYEPAIGALTGDNRDLWADARERLVAVSAKNAALLRKIESAMIVIVLDDTAPVTREDVSLATWTGSVGGRWFDKHQVIIYENGKAGFLGEHSCMDGTPTLRMNEFVLASIEQGKLDVSEPAAAAVGGKLEVEAEVEELVFDVNDEVKGLVKGAEGRYEELVGAHELVVQHYQAYGSTLIKHLKFSPDAYVQLVKQLAFQKMFGRPGVCYESCQTRKFKKGRTEVIRSVSEQSRAWAEAMVRGGGKTDPTHLRTLFSSAVARHIQYATWAADGQGVDRHLFGLKKLIRTEEGEEVPGIYKDEAFGKSSHWELSTSQLSSRYFDGWGYGEVVPDGYGLSYSIGDDYIRWTITSLRKDGKVLSHYLAEAATETREMLERAARVDKERAAAKEPKLKL